MARPVVALLTDFGLTDHYVGTMKGVVLSVCPDATLVDITHDVPPQDIRAAALELRAAYHYFPPATVFLVVVDPGVGTARRAIAAEAGGYYFVAPDNGVLSVVFADAEPGELVELTERRYARAQVSRTFEGRDRFAPAAGWIARGTSLRKLGPAVRDWTAIPVPRPQASDSTVRGEIVRVDRFGNLVTNVPVALLDPLARPLTVKVGGVSDIPLVETYGQVDAGELCALIGSSGHLEVAVSGGNASARLRAGGGTPVVIAAAQSAGD